MIDGDPSISRVHAKLFIQPDGTVFLTDLSKYGTSVNNKKLNKDQRYQLKEGDLIKFGNQPNKSEFRSIIFIVYCMICTSCVQIVTLYRLHKTQWIFCCSNMNANQKIEVKKMAIKLGSYPMLSLSSMPIFYY